MIRLNTVTQKLQIDLAAPVTTNELPVVVCYSDKSTTTYNGAPQVSNSNGTTAVDICDSPAVNIIRDIDYIGIRNADTVSATVSVIYNDNGTLYGEMVIALAAGDKLFYTHADGWRVLDNTGSLKTVTAAGGVVWGSITGTLSSQTDLQTALDDLADDIVALAAAL